MNGFVVLHRKILDWEWYDDPNTLRLFIHCILRANHAPQKWRGKLIERGQFISSRATLAQELGLSEQQIRTGIKKLESTGEITSQGKSQHTVFTVNSYSKYQDINQQDNQRITNDQPTDNQRITTNNNLTIKQLNNKDISVKQKKEKLSLESLPDDWKKSALDYWQTKSRFDISPDDQFFKFKNYHLAKGTLMIDWKAAWRTWYANAADYQKPNQDIPTRTFKPMKRAGSEE
jgi:biotin operon repressor